MWTPFKYFVGSWLGTGDGQPGTCRDERTYAFVMDGKYLHSRTRATFQPQEKNPPGEVHEDWGFVSYDTARKAFIYRQFQAEGFVNQYVLHYLAPDAKAFTFLSEAIENIPDGFRARESFRILGPDDFIDIFELADPGKNFEVYTETHLTRA